LIRIANMVIRIVIMLLALPLTFSYGYTAFHDFIAFGGADSKNLHLFLLGFGIFMPIWFIWGRYSHFLNTFEHEITHMLVGLLMFKRPHELHVTHGAGGHVLIQGSNNFIITLAPYFLPTFSYLLLLVYPLLADAYHPYFFVILGLITSYHVFSTWQETSLVQTDIHANGVVFSLLFIIAANIISYGFILAFILGGWHAGGSFLIKGVTNLKILQQLFS